MSRRTVRAGGDLFVSFSRQLQLADLLSMSGWDGDRAVKHTVASKTPHDEDI